MTRWRESNFIWHWEFQHGFGISRSHKNKESTTVLDASRRINILQVVLIALAAVSIRASATDFEGSSPNPAASSIISDDAMQILSRADIARYQDIFALQERGEWAAADKIIGKLDNDILIGHLLFQRYMHPTAYRSSFRELKSWMASYRDLPGATRIYRLAKRRQGRATAPKTPLPRYSGSGSDPVPRPSAKMKRSRADRRAVSRITSRVGRELRRGRPERAERYLWAFSRLAILSDQELDGKLGEIANTYLLAGNDEKALALGAYAAATSRRHFAQPDWIAGLGAWRLKNCQAAEFHFRNVLVSDRAGEWLSAAGGFWAARAALQCGRPEEVAGYLRRASYFRTTFYGLLAARQLGQDIEFDWSLPTLSTDQYTSLTASPGVQRSVALTEVGQYSLADDELRYAWNRGGEPVRIAVQALAARLNLPASQLLTSEAAKPGDRWFAATRYPMPAWIPEDGFSLDRALVFAMIRQESHFIPRVKSGPGAVGLMQVMPATASWLTNDRSLRTNRKNRLYEPALNMKLGQLYFLKVLGYAQTGGNLVKTLTAYNGGPGNLSRWERRMNYDNDPLLFVETVPARETRIHLEKVLANLWIYRLRLNQATPSLDALASGAWPPYEALDPEEVRAARNNKPVARHAGN